MIKASIEKRRKKICEEYEHLCNNFRFREKTILYGFSKIRFPEAYGF